MFTAPGFYSSANMGGVGGKSDTRVAWQVFIDLLEEKKASCQLLRDSAF